LGPTFRRRLCRVECIDHAGAFAWPLGHAVEHRRRNRRLDNPGKRRGLRATG
jgi:hypothetical protein